MIWIEHATVVALAVTALIYRDRMLVCERVIGGGP